MGDVPRGAAHFCVRVCGHRQRRRGIPEGTLWRCLRRVLPASATMAAVAPRLVAHDQRRQLRRTESAAEGVRNTLRLAERLLAAARLGTPQLFCSADQSLRVEVD